MKTEVPQIFLDMTRLNFEELKAHNPQEDITWEEWLKMSLEGVWDSWMDSFEKREPFASMRDKYYADRRNQDAN